MAIHATATVSTAWVPMLNTNSFHGGRRWGRPANSIVLVGERHESVLPLARMNRDEGSCRPALVQVPKNRPETLALPFRWEHAENHFHEKQQR